MKAPKTWQRNSDILLEQLEARQLLSAAFSVSNQAFALPAGSPLSTAVGTVAVDNPQSLSLAYSITGGNDSGAFAIDAATGLIEVALAAPLNVATNPTFPLTVSVVDAADNITHTATVTVDVWNLVLPLVSGQKLTFTDASGDVVNVLLNGEGAGSLCFPADAKDNPVNLGEVVLSGTTSQSTLSITPQHGNDTTTVGEIVVDGSLKSLSAPALDLIPTDGRPGGIIVNGTNFINTTRVRDLLGGADINMSFSASTISSITAGRLATGSDIALGSPLKTLTLSTWDSGVLSGMTVSTISVNGNASRVIVGNLGAGGVDNLGVAINLTGQDTRGTTLGTLSVAGTIQDSTVQTAGSITTISAGASAGSNFLAGVDAGVTIHPTSYADFTNLAATIGTFRIVGVKGSMATFSIADSNVSAPKLGTVNLTNTDMATTGLFAVSRISTVKNTSTTKHIPSANKAFNWTWSTSSARTIIPPSIVHLIPAALTIDVTGNYGQAIATDDAPSTANGTDFGSVAQGSTEPTRIFTLTSIGDRTLGPCTVTAPAGFTVIQTDLDAMIPLNGSGTFTVSLDTSAAGTFSGVVTITSLGTEYGVFTFEVTGTVEE